MKNVQKEVFQVENRRVNYKWWLRAQVLREALKDKQAYGPFYQGNCQDFTEGHSDTLHH